MHKKVWLFVFGVVATLGLQPAAAQTISIPPGLESEIARLVFADSAEDTGLGHGWHVENTKILPHHIEVNLRKGQSSAIVAMRPRRSETSGEAIGKTASFSLWLVDGAEVEGAQRAAKALLVRVTKRDEGDFFVQARGTNLRRGGERISDATGVPVQAHFLGRADNIRRLIAWLGLFFLLAFLSYEKIIAIVRERRWKQVRTPLSFGAGLFVLALTMRLLIPPWAPLHENTHGIKELRGLAGAEGLSTFSSEISRYGVAYPQFFRTVLSPLGVNGEAPLALNALFGALTVVALFFLAKILFEKFYWAPWIAAIGLAFHPAHIRVSLSESPSVLAALLLVVGICAGFCALEQERPKVFRHIFAWVSGISLALACELRVQTLMIPVAAASVIIIVGLKAKSWRQDGLVLLGPILFTALASVLHYVALEPIRISASQVPLPNSFELVAAVFSSSNIVFDLSLTSFLLVPLCVVGGVVLMQRKMYRILIAIVVATALLMIPSFIACASRSCAIRYQTYTHVLLFLLPPVIVWRWSSKFLPALLVMALLIVPSSFGIAAISQPDFQERSYLISARQTPAAPTPIAILPERMFPHILEDFPDYLVEQPRRVRRGKEGLKNYYVFVGPSCWSFNGSERVTTLDGVAFRQECTDFLGGPERARQLLETLEPVQVPFRHWERFLVIAEEPRIGFVYCGEGTDLIRERESRPDP